MREGGRSLLQVSAARHSSVILDALTATFWMAYRCVKKNRRPDRCIPNVGHIIDALRPEVGAQNFHEESLQTEILDELTVVSRMLHVLTAAFWMTHRYVQKK